MEPMQKSSRMTANEQRALLPVDSRGATIRQEFVTPHLGTPPSLFPPTAGQHHGKAWEAGREARPTWGQAGGGLPHTTSPCRLHLAAQPSQFNCHIG